MGMKGTETGRPTFVMQERQWQTGTLISAAVLAPLRHNSSQLRPYSPTTPPLVLLTALLTVPGPHLFPLTSHKPWADKGRKGRTDGRHLAEASRVTPARRRSLDFSKTDGTTGRGRLVGLSTGNHEKPHKVIPLEQVCHS